MKYVAIVFLVLCVPAYSEPRNGPKSYDELTADDLAEIARGLIDYGMWRWEEDRKTFPKDMPKEGEPYDPITGERKVAKGDKYAH
jgi:hypothetical protein